jgi:hypothetical protein
LARFGLLAADFLADFEDGIGGAEINRFMASSKLTPFKRRSMAFGIFVFALLAGKIALFFPHQKHKVKPA